MIAIKFAVILFFVLDSLPLSIFSLVVSRLRALYAVEEAWWILDAIQLFGIINGYRATERIFVEFVSLSD